MKVKELWFQLINSNDKPPRIYIVSAGVLFLLMVMDVIIVVTLDPLMMPAWLTSNPYWRLYLIAVEIGAVVLMVAGFLAWLIFKNVTWYSEVVSPAEEFLSEVSTTAVIGRNK